MTRSPLNGAGIRTRVAIVGFDTLTRSQAPWDDPMWDIWGLNGAHEATGTFRDAQGRFRADRWFQIHPPESLSASERRFFEQQYALGVPTYVRAQDVDTIRQEWPIGEAGLLPYPIDDIRQQFPGAPLASTFCLEIALALHRGYEMIGLFGIDSRDLGRELVVERPALTYWIGVANGRGVTVTMPPAGTLMHHPFVYGFDYLKEASYAAMLTELVLPRRLITQDPTGNLNTVESVTQAAATLRE